MRVSLLQCEIDKHDRLRGRPFGLTIDCESVGTSEVNVALADRCDALNGFDGISRRRHTTAKTLNS
jgi:hypothetical protein